MTVRIERREIDAYWRATVGDGTSRTPSDAWIAENIQGIVLAAAGIGPTARERLREHYGRNLNALIGQDPFRLYAEHPAVTFEQAAFLYRRSDVRAPVTLAAAALFKVARDQVDAGNVYSERRMLLERARAISSLPAETIGRAWSLLLGRSTMSEFDLEGVPRAMLTRHAREEQEIAATVRHRAGLTIDPLRPDHATIAAALARAGCTTPDASQLAAVELALANPTSLVTGGPGSGKTSIIAAIAGLTLDSNPEATIVCVSLAARIARAIHGRTGIAADTIHKFLDWRDGVFTHDADHKVACDLLFVEEAFMLDNSLFAALLRAVPDRARIVIIGDPGQLEPIGRGMPVHAIVEAGALPHAILTGVHRSGHGSTIPISGQRALKGLMPIVGDDLIHIPTVSTPETLRAVLQVWRKSVAAAGPDAVQVLAGAHRGTGGVKAINDAITGRPDYVVGDRVMQLRNDRANDVFNGETGRIVEIGAHGLTVVTDAGATVEYPSLNPSTLSKAYCISVHKAQGLEYPHVINVLHPSSRRLLTRGLVNVGITRAKVHCTIIDQKNQLGRALATPSASPRLTLLPHMLAGRDPLI
jgi:exodeoxyribonuclease V alpha subunit